MLPLEYMLGVMRDGSAEPSRRDDMAKAAGRFLHARLSATKIVIKRPEDMTDDKLAAALAAAERIASGDGEPWVAVRRDDSARAKDVFIPPYHPGGRR